jgi:hypothetical protein
MGQVITNKNTSQTPMTGTGLTGVQTEFFVPASRIYLKAVDAVPAAPILLSDGITPTGWTDLGAMRDNGQVTYTKNTVKLLSGIDKKLRKLYTDQVTGSIEATLGQYDDVVLSKITGLTPYVVQSGSIVRFPIGAESVVQSAVLFVSQNKTDGKEMQYYNPSAFLTFSIVELNGAQCVKLTADFPTFIADGAEQLFALSVFAHA